MKTVLALAIIASSAAHAEFNYSNFGRYLRFYRDQLNKTQDTVTCMVATYQASPSCEGNEDLSSVLSALFQSSSSDLSTYYFNKCDQGSAKNINTLTYNIDHLRRLATTQPAEDVVWKSIAQYEQSLAKFKAETMQTVEKLNLSAVYATECLP